MPVAGIDLARRAPAARSFGFSGTVGRHHVLDDGWRLHDAIPANGSPTVVVA